MQVDRRRRDRSVTEIVAYRCQIGTACERVSRMRMSSPVRARAMQLFREYWVVRFDDLGRFRKKPRDASRRNRPRRQLEIRPASQEAVAKN